MSAPRFSTEDKMKIVRDYRLGIPIKSIAEKYGIHQSYPGRLSRRVKRHEDIGNVAVQVLTDVQRQAIYLINQDRGLCEEIARQMVAMRERGHHAMLSTALSALEEGDA